ncbi:thiol reductant ABC exporter subunit CydD [Plastoroseomonas arctica]|uniref:Thiol reductant ABC exporter subunit CydD n=1 Tax=Plastoroseomonas arctica TaxID=1509237 RepID=A0AAF1KHD1_9PROT|nr:thiol reductant ABC exporter subunit CydD [Plastoroseomonas arctica]MBR0653819.1 thiol reductant ABC exporter subunit CydD [Plastoroseomonas arctica]
MARPLVIRSVGIGVALVAVGIAEAWLIAGLLARLLGFGDAGWPALVLAGGLALIAAGLGIAQERAQVAAGEAAKARLRAQAFSRLLDKGVQDLRPVGARTALVVDRVDAMEGYFARWVPAAMLAIIGPLMVAGAAGAMDGVTGWILVVAGLMVPVAQAGAGIGAAAASRRQFGALQALSGRFLDRMRGLPTLVLFNREKAEQSALGVRAEELRVRTMKVLRVAFLSSGAMELIAAATLACIAIRHGAVLGEAHPDPTAALFALLLVPAFFQPLRLFAQAYHERLSATGAAADLAPLLGAVGTGGGLVLETVPPRVTVTFDNVSLTYDSARGAALDGLSFRVGAGETLVLMGASGAGKTSVLRLLMGFARPDGGRIAFNGRDAMALRPDELRRMTAYVGQRAHLFRGTLAENIRLSRPEADEAAVQDAAAAARVMDFAADLPLGLDTVVGEGGFGLSGGQAQRVAVARAFLRDAPLVLLDEPTAHLDPGTEAEVMESLKRLCLGRTAIIATHARGFRAWGAAVLDLAGGRALGKQMAGD